MPTKHINKEAVYLRQIILSEEEIKLLVIIGAQEVLILCKKRRIKKMILAMVLTGSIFFAADLAREISRLQKKFDDDDGIREIEFILDTISCWRYNHETESNRVIEIRKHLDHDPMGKHILFIEDIIDVGLTGRDLAKITREKKPAGIYLISLLQKPARTTVKMDEYFDEVIVLKEIDDHFVQGYGLDKKDQGRCDPDIGYIE